MAHGPRLVYESGLPLNAKLSRVIEGLHWTLPNPRSEDILEVQILICDSIVPTQSEDLIQWLPSKSKVLGTTWNWVRRHHQKVPWFTHVWFAKVVPRQALICRLAVLDRLSTRSRQHRHNSSIVPAVFSMVWKRQETTSFLSVIILLKYGTKFGLR